MSVETNMGTVVRVSETVPGHADLLGPITFVVETGNCHVQTYMTRQQAHHLAAELLAAADVGMPTVESV